MCDEVSESVKIRDTVPDRDILGVLLRDVVVVALNVCVNGAEIVIVVEGVVVNATVDVLDGVRLSVRLRDSVTVALVVLLSYAARAPPRRQKRPKRAT